MQKNLHRQVIGPRNPSGAPALARLSVASLANIKPGPSPVTGSSDELVSRYRAVLDMMPQGACMFDKAGRLTACNDRYTEIYRLTVRQTSPGRTRREIEEGQLAAGTSPKTRTGDSPGASTIKDETTTVELEDGRTIRIRRRALPEGGCAEIHEEFEGSGASVGPDGDRISLQTLIDWVPDYLWVKDKEGRFLVANKALAIDGGYTATEDVIGLSDFDIHELEVARSFHQIEVDILRSGQPMADTEEVIVNAAGETKWLLSTKEPLRSDSGEIIGLVGIARDITARRQADALSSGQSRILEMIATSAPLTEVLEALMHLIESQLSGIFGSVMLLDADGVHLHLGAAPSLDKAYCAAIEGARIGPRAGSCGTAAYRREPVIVADIDSDPLWKGGRHIAGAHGYRSCWSTPILSHQGSVLGVFAMYSTTVRRPTEAETRLVETATRIAGIAIERKLAEDQVSYLAHHDALTGLPNRVLLMDRLTQATLQAKRNDRRVTVIFADLDNFKLVNDSLGHDAGDALLKAVAKRMLDNVRVTDSVVRIGGDEFVILLVDQSGDADAALNLIEKIRSAIAEPLLIAGQSLQVTCSMGIATFPCDSGDAAALLRNADIAMYQAKSLGRDNFQFFTPAMNSKVHERLSLREEMRMGLARSEFYLVYQPQVDLDSGQVFAVEALVRWEHPILGVISPGKFIPLAEESGMIVQLGEWVLREACRQNKEWQDAGLPPVSVCVNVSARQFRDRAWTARVKEALAESGLEARYLELELTESLLMQDVERAVGTMQELQGLGVHFAIDDFGTGYSSLSALKNFPVARLKIDQSFVRNLPRDADDRGIAAAVISLGQKLNMRVIAEGVETSEQMAFLRENHCDEIQGYHFSKPVSPGAIPALLKSRIVQPDGLASGISTSGTLF